jgi:hypothetical protein
VFLWAFAVIGVGFVGAFFAIKFGVFDVKGSISDRNSYFNFSGKKAEASNTGAATDGFETICKINVLDQYAPLTSIDIYYTLNHGGDDSLIAQMIQTASQRFNDDPAFITKMNDCQGSSASTFAVPMSAYNWADTDDWNLMKEVFTRDQDVIKKAAADAHISPRLLLAGVIGEQFRFFVSRREELKSYFEPMKILASLSNTSYGIAGLKPKTVLQIETNLKDPTSPYYLGPDMEHIADHDPSVDVSTDIMNRITDTKDPYYSYLYIGLFMKEIEAQWQKAGYDVSNRPDVLATLYNLGFYYSVPKSNPQAGGAVITVNGVDYTFGDLGYEFYYSGELSDVFPLTTQQ